MELVNILSFVDSQRSIAIAVDLDEISNKAKRTENGIITILDGDKEIMKWLPNKSHAKFLNGELLHREIVSLTTCDDGSLGIAVVGEKL